MIKKRFLLFICLFICPARVLSDFSGSLKSAGRAEADAFSKLGEKIFETGKHEYDTTVCNIKNNSTKEITVTNIQPTGFAGTKSTTIKIKPGQTQQLSTPFSVDKPSIFVPKCPHGVATVSNTDVSVEPQ